MTEGQRLHYSRDHWEKQFRACLKNSLAYETRVHRRGYYFLNFDSNQRAEEVLASCRDRIIHAYVNGCSMATDPLRLDGISFGRMLDDAKRQLRADIDRKAKEFEVVERLKFEITKMFFTMRATQMYYQYVSASSFAGRYYYGLDFGEGRDRTVVRKIYYWPARRAGKTGGAQRDKLFVNEILSGTWSARLVKKIKRIFHVKSKRNGSS